MSLLFWTPAMRIVILSRQPDLYSTKALVPPTVFTRTPEHVRRCIEMAEGPPVVVKLLQGTQGIGVVLAETEQAASSVIEAFHGLDENILIQKFIRESRGADIRAFVVGREV